MYLEKKKVEEGGGKERSVSLLWTSTASNIFRRFVQFHRGESERPKSISHCKVTEQPWKCINYNTRKLGCFI